MKKQVRVTDQHVEAIVAALDSDQLSALRYRSMELLEDLADSEDDRNEAFRATLREELQRAVDYYLHSGPPLP
jgi:hypothetical protein